MSKKKAKKKENRLKAILRTSILEQFKKNPGKSFNYKQMSHALKTKDGDTRKLVVSILRELKVEDHLLEIFTGKYKLKETKAFISGTVDMTRSGSAYVISDELDEDVFISPRNLGTALNGDTVKVYLFARKKSKKPEGEVVKIISRSKMAFAGIVEISKKFAFLIPDDPKMPVDIYIPLQSLNGALNGQKAIAQITDWPDGATSPFGEITVVLGTPGESEAEIRSILADHGFPLGFSKEVENSAAAIPNKIPSSEVSKRKDLRHITTFTIDPFDAKDFDDALSFRKLKNGNVEIGIHIADVTHYVREGDAIDLEASDRATSVYLVDRVIPMLPEVLSNQLCSLRPNEDKCCFSVIVEMDQQANIVRQWVGKTLICSDNRFTYEEAQQVIGKGKGLFADELLTINGLAKTLRDRRMKNGAIGFEKIEVSFRLDDQGLPSEVVFKVQKDAHKLIEEFMLLANRLVAEMIGKTQAGEHARTFVYRIHEPPNPEKVRSFAQFIGSFGYQLKTNNNTALARSMNDLMKKIKGKPEENTIELLAIRTMSKAIYSTDNVGHYGLAFDHYTHFTSPIRRYPDMMVHRLLERYLSGGKSANQEEAEELCKHASEKEQEAIGAERDSIKLFQVMFMKDRIGQVFKGVISGVTEWGLYVEIIENKCEGMVRLRNIDDDYYVFDEEKLRIIGHRYGRVFQFGDEVSITVTNADLAKKQMDFQLVVE